MPEKCTEEEIVIKISDLQRLKVNSSSSGAAHSSQTFQLPVYEVEHVFLQNNIFWVNRTFICQSFETNFAGVMQKTKTVG